MPALMPRMVATVLNASVHKTGALARMQSSVPVPKNRVLSPHLRIYKFRSNMISSVVFRGTGIAMMGGEFAMLYFLQLWDRVC